MSHNDEEDMDVWIHLDHFIPMAFMFVGEKELIQDEEATRETKTSKIDHRFLLFFFV